MIMFIIFYIIPFIVVTLYLLFIEDILERKISFVEIVYCILSISIPVLNFLITIIITFITIVSIKDFFINKIRNKR